MTAVTSQPGKTISAAQAFFFSKRPSQCYDDVLIHAMPAASTSKSQK